METVMNLSPRDLLALSGMALAATTLRPSARYLATQQYYVQMPTGIYVAVWDGASKNCGPNLRYDYGGRLMAAWLDR
jgi:hypothetical protein